ncbi:flagellar basal body-associated FliL family protein [Candidatus Sumerlaeota bacterium]|nr:flagellar basal body-associated FliL family protein [Candidatus Sumerlaeota bacterium]
MAKDNQTQAADAAKKSKLPLIIIGVVVLAALGAGGFIGYQQIFAKAPAEEGETGNGAGSEGDEVALAYLDVPQTKQVFNLKEPRSYCHLQITVVIPEADEALKERLLNREPQLTDMLINIMNEKSTADLSSKDGLTDLKNEIRGRLDTVIDASNVQDVLIKQFLIQ